MAFKDFTPAQILTSQEVDTYLMRQAIMSFASSTARDAAITTPTEGMVAYLEDTNTFWFYNGSAWQNLGNVMRYASAAARASALPSPVEGMVSYLQDTDELQFYDGANWLTVVVTSDDEGFVTSGSVTAVNGGADGGIVLRQWTGSSSYQSIATRDMAGNEYMMLSDGTNTIVGSGVGGATYVKGPNNDATHQLSIGPSAASFWGQVAVGSDALVSANTSSQLHVRKDNAGGKGGEISIVNYATNTVGNSAAVNFAVDQSSYGSDSGNAQIRATNQSAANSATELGFYTWNGAAWKKRWYIGSDAVPRTNMSWFLATDGQYHGTAAILAYRLVPQVSPWSSYNGWVTIANGSVDGQTANIGYAWFEYKFTAYISTAGSFYSRILTQPSGGGSYASNMVYHFRNNTYDHFHVGWTDLSYVQNQYCNYFLQVYGNGVTIQADGNDSAEVVVWAA